MTAAAFLAYYHFDVRSSSQTEWAEQWRIWPEPWLWAALLEALHQGRYKAVSVENVLQSWRSRGEVRLSFNPAFVQNMWPDAAPHLQLLWERRAAKPEHLPAVARHPFDDIVLPTKWLSLLSKTTA